MKDLSIIVPVFNGEEYIKKCINELEKIDELKYEIIVVNDGSSDNTDKIIKELEKEYSNIKYINNKKNSGVSFSRNEGIKNATGEYIGFADVDDELCADMYLKLYNNAKKNNSDISVCNYYEIIPSTSMKVNSKYNYEKDYIKGDEALKMFLTDRISPAIWDKLFKKELASKIDFSSKLAIGEDILFCLTAFSRCKSACFINERLYGYMQNETSVMHTISPKHTQFIKVLDYIEEKDKKNIEKNFKEEYEFFRLQMITRGIHSISNLVNKNNKKEAINLLKNYYVKSDLKKIVKNKYFSKAVRLEIFNLKTFGIRFHLFMEPIYKAIRNRTR